MRSVMHYNDIISRIRRYIYLYMAIVYQHDKRHNVTYVYYSESYYDKEKKQSRSKRTLIGRLDPESKEIVPVRKSKRSKPLPIDILDQLDKENQKEEIHEPSNDQITVLKMQMHHLQEEIENEKRNTQREQEKIATLISKLEHVLEEYK